MPAEGARFEPVDFRGLEGFSADDCLAAFRCFRRSAEALVSGAAAPRSARPPSPGLVAAARTALALGETDAAGARRFFETGFRPFRVLPGAGRRGFLTGYYEPLVPASPVETPGFSWPILARPRRPCRLCAGGGAGGAARRRDRRASARRRLAGRLRRPAGDRAGAGGAARVGQGCGRGFSHPGAGVGAGGISGRDARPARL